MTSSRSFLTSRERKIVFPNFKDDPLQNSRLFHQHWKGVARFPSKHSMLVRSIFLHHTHPRRDRCVEVALQNDPTFSVRGLGDSSVFASRSLTFTRKAPRSCALLTTASTKLCTIDHSLTDLTAARIGADLVEMGSRLTFSHSQTALISSTQGVISS